MTLTERRGVAQQNQPDGARRGAAQQTEGGGALGVEGGVQAHAHEHQHHGHDAGHAAVEQQVAVLGSFLAQALCMQQGQHGVAADYAARTASTNRLTPVASV